MDISNMKKISVNNLEVAWKMIKNHETFAISDAINTSDIARKIESIIESMNMKCRVYTANRSIAMLSTLIPTPFTLAMGTFSLVSIGIHNLVTWNPDYEIIKCIVDNQVVVVYKK